jgi:histidine triad (HIT) family protein
MNIFRKIIDRQIPADIVYEDDKAIAFRDISPQAPVHVLIVPKKDISGVADIKVEDREVVGHLLFVAREVAASQGVKDYRLVINNGAAAGQSVLHLHVHLLGGRAFDWPPG